MKLPIRFVPRRSSSITTALALPLIGVFVLGPFIADVLDAVHTRGFHYVVTDQTALIVALAIGAVVLSWMEVFAILRVLPGSPYFHLDVTLDGLTRREFKTEKFFAWDKIESLDLVGRMQGSKRRRMHYWLLLEAKTPPTHGRDDISDSVDQRIKHALLAYDTEELAPMFSNSRQIADDLLQFLRCIHANRLKGAVPDEAPITPLLREVIAGPDKRALLAQAGPAVAKPRRSGGVIER